MTKTLALIFMVLLAWAFAAYMLMVTVGVVHADWIPQLPVIGWQFAVLLSGLTMVRLLVSAWLSAAVRHVMNDKS